MPTKKQIAIINSKKRPTRGFSESDLTKAGINAINQVESNRFEARLNIQKVYGRYGWSGVSSSFNVGSFTEYIKSYPTIEKTIAK